jgi:hypothetical protein
MWRRDRASCSTLCFPRTLLMSLQRNGDDDASYCKERDNVIAQRVTKSFSRITRRMLCVLLRGRLTVVNSISTIDHFDISGRRWRVLKQLRDDIRTESDTRTEVRVVWRLCGRIRLDSRRLGVAELMM